MITAQIASLPERVDSLKKTVYSLYNQVDEIFVALNGYNSIPEFLKQSKIRCEIMDNSLGDAAKFYGVEKLKGYVFTCDDDLKYPQGYAHYMISKIRRHRCPVSLLGKSYTQKPILSFKSGYTALYRCLGSCDKDRVVDVIGTGAMAFHTNHIKISTDDFVTKNMADVWFAKAAREQGVPVMVVSHPAHYVKYTKFDYRIWSSMKDDTFQTAILNSFL